MIAIEKSNMEKTVQFSCQENSCDGMLEISMKDKEKILAMAEKDALKEAEWKVKGRIE